MVSYTLGRYSSHIDRKTTDGGVTWNTLSNPIPQGLSTKGMQHIPGTTSTYILTGIGRHGINALVLTNDAGESWSIYDNECNFFEFPSVSVGWVSFDTNAVKKYIGPPLPVELTSFTATTNGKEVILNWTTATELNNQGFEIQRSTEGKEFYSVGFVNGHGTINEQHNYSYSDRNLDNGKYNYRLKQVDYDGSFEYSDVVEIEWRAFNSYLLEQNYPNPFNPTTTIGFGLQNKSNVKITILNAIGEEVAVVLNEDREPGFHKIEFNATNLPSGVYFYQLKAGRFY